MTQAPIRKPLFPLPVKRPNLRWIEAMLGESLQGLAKPPLYGTVQLRLDASVIPMGEHCYQPMGLATGYEPCPYFTNTAYGTVRCAYTQVEAYDYGTIDDDCRVIFIERFGSCKQAEAAGVVNMFDLPDSEKICGVNLADPSWIENHLEPAVENYEQATRGERIHESIYRSQRYAAMQRHEASLETAALDRYEVWECLCSMVEAVQPELVRRIQLADAIFRGATRRSETAIENHVADDFAVYENPEKQFWYLYRADFDNPVLGPDQVSLLTWAKGWRPSLDLPLPLYRHGGPDD